MDEPNQPVAQEHVPTSFQDRPAQHVQQIEGIHGSILHAEGTRDAWTQAWLAPQELRDLDFLNLQARLFASLQPAVRKVEGIGGCGKEVSTCILNRRGGDAAQDRVLLRAFTRQGWRRDGIAGTGM